MRLPERARPLACSLALPVALALVPARGAHAQGGMGVAAGAAQHEAARDAAARRAPGADTTVGRRAEPELAALLLARRDAFVLRAVQVAPLSALAARADSVIPPMEAEIEALTVRASADEWRTLTPERAEVLRTQSRRRSALVAALHDERRRLREATLALLTESQRAEAIDLERTERAAATDRLRRTRNGGWGGFRGARDDSTRRAP